MMLTTRGKVVFSVLWVLILIAFYVFFPIIPPWV